MERKTKIRKSKMLLIKRNKLPDFNTKYKVTVIKTVGFQWKGIHIDKLNRVQKWSHRKILLEVPSQFNRKGQSSSTDGAGIEGQNMPK